MAKSYGVTTDIIPAKGGMGPGGVGNISPKGSMSKTDVRARIDEKDAAAEVRRQRRLDKLSKARDEQRRQLSEADTPEGIAFRKQEYDMLSDFKKGGMVKSKASSRADGCAKRGKTRGRMC
jgi:hypothetical protein